MFQMDDYNICIIFLFSFLFSDINSRKKHQTKTMNDKASFVSFFCNIRKRENYVYISNLCMSSKFPSSK